MDDIVKKRQINERKFNNYEDLPNGGRRYWSQVKGKSGYTAKYVKEVNNKEEFVRFCQEIYNEQMEFIEIHKKFPIDRGHRKISGGKPWKLQNKLLRKNYLGILIVQLLSMSW